MFVKKIIEILVAGIMAISLLGSGTEAEPVVREVPKLSGMGVELLVKEVTSAGLTLVIKQNGGAPIGELHTGSFYLLEQFVNGEWVLVPYAVATESEIAWTEEAWIIPMNGLVSREVNWEGLYGKLTKGKYRIGKEITDFRQPGDYEKEMHYAEFEVTQ